MKMSYANVAAVCVVLVLLLGKAQVSMGVTCNALQLSPCASAITSSTPPSPLCCSKLKEQRPCLCNYVKDPNLQKLVNSPNARKVASICGSPFPNC
ncbi:PREDICTED: non-specific lipid-transfer protein 2 [Theobroma cacao]|uniref:Non-specific lipid-transfer protein 2 n=2 Tax=Theobroma cacao TaxID=3641 RepID=A0AB32VXM0_THECC|nr:PREDICTED: non-specific lipid-transfer protein 2 [Theobroma cacao]EOY00067.1 Bifunctional inhibitor/lipid-transfer protein/seed storage 2S albumin superfamily protein, putative [Theobroma cacao]